MEKTLKWNAFPYEEPSWRLNISAPISVMQAFWQQCLESLKRLTQNTPKIYTTWFEVLKPTYWNEKDGILTLEAPATKITYIRGAYQKSISAVATRIHGSAVAVSLVPAQVKPVQREESGTSHPPSETEIKRREETGLLPGLTFENYVNGNANQLAVAAAEHVATTTGTQYNPLYIYGGVGLGKTHLMQAIGHRYLDLHPKARVRCVSAQDFINEYTSAVRESTNKTHASLEKFDERYRSLDLLLIDDVQSLSGAKGSQGQFFRAFEALVPHNKQLVITSDTYTRGLKDIEPRLISRLSQGLSVAIEPPEFEMRTAILLNKAKTMGVDLPDEVAAYIAKRLKSNVRELEGALQQVVAYQQFQATSSREITIDIAKRVLREQFQVVNSLITIENIQKNVADYYKIKVADMYSKRRPANIARPRQIAMYLTKELTQHSLPEIGENFGGRDHTTVMHAVRKITQERQNDAELNHEIHVLEQMIRG